MDQVEKQPIPSDVSCPSCGADPEYNPNHILSSVGYHHDDIQFSCSECDYHWMSGVPIGEYEGPLAEKLLCSACEKRYGLVHQIRPLNDGRINLRMKCPNNNCYNHWTIEREIPDGDEYILVGYPQITGNTDGATPRGY